MADIAEAGVRIGLEVTGEREAERAIDNLRKAQLKQNRSITQAILKANQLAKKSAAIIAKGSNAEIRSKQESTNANKEIAKALQERIIKLGKVEKALETLKLKEGMLTGKGKKSAREGVDRLNAQIKKREEQIKVTRRELLGEKQAAMGAAVFEGKRKKAKDKAKEAKEVMAKFSTYGGKEAGKDIADGFKDAIGAISARDMQGMAKGLAKSLGHGAMAIGAKMKRYSLAKGEKGEGGGLMAKAMGKMGGAIGSIVGLLAKIGPILSMVGGVVVAIVKLFVDAEAAAKEFNKEVLATASTSEHLYAAGGNAVDAYDKLADTMKQIRDSSTDLWANMEWGISKKQHSEFLSGLTSEGVSIKAIEKQAEAANMAVGEFSAEMVHVGVAYSRMMGVSLQEISTFQAEMFREMGASQETVSQSFRMMTRGAAESGIASNKFFAIIRGVTADMSLFNLRMEDAVMTLKMLGKAMSPKNAEKFLQTLTSFYKGQDLQGKVKATILAGGAEEVGAMAKEDMNARITGMANDVATKINDPAAAGKLINAINAGPEATSKFIAENQAAFEGEGGGAMIEAINDASITQGKLAKGGLIDVADTIGEMSPQFTMKMWDNIAKKNFGKPLKDLSNEQLLAFDTMAGTNTELRNQAIKADRGMKQMKENLAYRLEKGEALTEEQTAMVKSMGLKGVKEDAANVRNMTDAQLWGTMTDLQRKQANGTDTALDYAKEQVKAIDTVGDKIDRIFDALLNEIYNVLAGIWDTVLEWAGDKVQKADRQIQKAARSSKNPELLNILKETGGDSTKFAAAMEQSSTWQKGVLGMLGRTAQTTEEQAAKEDLMLRLQQKMSPDEVLKAVIAANKKGAGISGTDMVYKLGDTTEPEAQARGLAAMQALPMEQQLAILKQIPKALDPAKLAGILPDVGADVQRAYTGAGYNAAAQAQLGVITPEQAAPKTEAEQKAAEAIAKVNQVLVDAQKAAGGPGVRTGATTLEKPSVGQAPEAPEATDEDKAALKAQQIVADLTPEFFKPGTAYFKFSPDFLNGAYSKAVQGAVEEGVLPSIRKALFEYFMYSGMNPEDLAKGLQEGTIDPAAFGPDLVTAIQEKGYDEGTKSVLPTSTTTAPAQAAGGVVTGVAGGMAVVKRPAAGEGLASIGKGEAITPAGGRGGGAQTIRLELSQDLKRVIQAEAGNVVYLDKARSRYQG